MYATDRDSYVVQGWKITDEDTASKLALTDGETAVEVYAKLLDHLAADGVTGTVVRWTPPHRPGKGERQTSYPEKAPH